MVLSMHDDGITSSPNPGMSGVGLARLSHWLLVGVPAGIVFLTVWATLVDTSPTLADETRVRGWGTIVRELPATLPLLAFPIIGLLLAVRAGRRGALPAALRAIAFHGFAFFFVLLVVINGSIENIMTTRPSTVKWLFFPAQVGIVVLAVVMARRAAARPGPESLVR